MPRMLTRGGRKKSKILPREDGTIKIIKKLNDNAYKVDVAQQFRGSMLVPNLRTNSLQERENDVNKDLHNVGDMKKEAAPTPQGSMTWGRLKRIKIVSNGTRTFIGPFFLVPFVAKSVANPRMSLTTSVTGCEKHGRVERKRREESWERHGKIGEEPREEELDMSKCRIPPFLGPKSCKTCDLGVWSSQAHSRPLEAQAETRPMEANDPIRSGTPRQRSRATLVPAQTPHHLLDLAPCINKRKLCTIGVFGIHIFPPPLSSLSLSFFTSYTHSGAQCCQRHFSRSRESRLGAEKPKVTRGDRLEYQRTLVDLILNVLASRGGSSPSTMAIVVEDGITESRPFQPPSFTVFKSETEIVHLYSVHLHLAETKLDCLYRYHLGIICAESDLASAERLRQQKGSLSNWRRCWGHKFLCVFVCQVNRAESESVEFCLESVESVSVQ
ncbi:hypothetical protein CR513_41362, partial [Mucuna pruriens]